MAVRGTFVSMYSRAWAAAVALLSVALIAGAVSPVAHADGDPGSDVLVYQDLFAGSDAGLSVQQQVQLGEFAQGGGTGGLSGPGRDHRQPVRSGRGHRAVAQTARLRAVSWDRAVAGVQAAAAGGDAERVRLQLARPLGSAGVSRAWRDSDRTGRRRAVRRGGGGSGEARGWPAASSSPSVAPPAGASAAPSSGGASAARPARASRAAIDDMVGIVALALAAIAVVALSDPRPRPAAGLVSPATGRRPAVAAARGPAAVGDGRNGAARRAGAITLVILARSDRRARRRPTALATNPDLDPGTPVSGVAPDFTLVGPVRSARLAALVPRQGRDPRVQRLRVHDVCPLTTTAMLDAKAMLGKAGSQVQLLGVDADPAAISLEDVWSYSELHGMLHAWQFLTGSLPQLKQVWKHYGIEAAVQAGEITHTPALFVIGPQGRLSRLYMTQMSYTAVATARAAAGRERVGAAAGPSVGACRAVLRARAADHPEPARDAASRGRRDRRARPRATPRGCSCSSPPGIRRPAASPASSMRSTGYEAIAARTGLPQLTAVDEASVEPSSATRDQLPARSAAAAVVSGRDRSQRQGRRWLRGAGPAMVRADLADRSAPLLPRGLDRRLAQPRAF